MEESGGFEPGGIHVPALGAGGRGGRGAGRAGGGSPGSPVHQPRLGAISAHAVCVRALLAVLKLLSAFPVNDRHFIDDTAKCTDSISVQ